MGSCLDPVDLHELLCSELIHNPNSERPECSDTVPDLSDSNMDQKGGLDGGVRLLQNGNAGCVGSGSGVQDVVASAGVKLVSECGNVALVAGKGLEEDVCGVSKDCLDETPMEIGQSRGRNDGLVNMLENLGMSSVGMTLDGSHEHCGRQSKHEAESVGVLGDEDIVDGLPQIMPETHDEAVSSLGCEKHEEFFCGSSLPISVEHGKRENAIFSEKAAVTVEKSVSLSALQSESIESDMKEGFDGLATAEIGTRHTINSSPVCDIPAVSEQMSCLLEGVAGPDRYDTASGTSSERAIVVMENSSVNLNEIVNGNIQGVAKDSIDSLVVTDMGAHGDSVQLLGYQLSEELIQSSHLPRKDTGHDNEGSDTSAEKPLVVVVDSVDLTRIENVSMLNVVEDRICSASVIETETHGKTPSKQCFEVHAGLLSVKCSPSNGTEQDKQSGNDSQEVDAAKDKNVPLVGPDIQSHNQMLPTLQQRISSESVSIKGNCDQSEDLTRGCSFTEPSMEDKINSVAATEFSNQVLSTQGFDNSMEFFSSTSSPEGVQRDEGKKDICFLSPYVKGDTEIKKEESDILPSSESVINNHIFSSVDSDMSAFDIPCNYAKKNKCREDEFVNGHFTENMILEGKNIPNDATVDGYKGTLHMEEKTFELKENLVASHCFEKPVSKQSCKPLISSDDGSHKKLGHLGILGVDAFDTVTSGSAVDHSGDVDHEGMDHARASGDCGSEAKLLHIALPSSGRSHGIRKSSRKAQTKRTVKKCRKNEKVRDPHGSAEIFLEYARKKRSCFSKLARASEWGSLGNVTQAFILSNGLSRDVFKSNASKKRRVGRETGKRKNNRTSTSSRSRKSSEKHHASTSRIRLKVKLGSDFGQSGLSFVMPKVVGTSASTDVVISDGGSESCQGIGFGIPNFATDVQHNLGDEKSAHVLRCFDNKQDCESSSVDELLAGDVEGTMFSKKSDGDAAENGIPTSLEVEASGVATENRYTDPGTSPDSEVINTVPEGKTCVKCTEDFLDGALSYSKAYTASSAVSAVAGGKRAKKKDVIPPACNTEDESPCLASLKKGKPSKKSRRRQQKDVGLSSCEVLSTSTCATASSNSFGRQELALEQSVLSRETEPHISWEDSKVETSEKVEVSCDQDVGPGMSESQLSKNLLPSTKSMGSHLPRRSFGVRKEKSKASNAARSRTTNNCRKKGNKLKSVNEDKIKRKGVSDCACEEDDPNIGNLTEDGVGKTNLRNDVPNVDSSNLELSSSAVMDQYIPSDDAWVRCDDCYKWRRIPVSIVDSIGEANCQWICKDNTDKAFADCSIPQEKSNAEINAELGLSDADADAYDFPSDFKGLECTQKPTSKENEFAHITTNQFSHRSRKTQTIDEIMVCHCKAPVDGNLGCGDVCLNRMLNIECVRGTCPCGELCSNQQFQKRNYAKMKWDRCGKKGFGLRMEEDISIGQFLIEYVGEVLDVHVYAERLKEYASKGHKHFYFMTLDGSEVIDACAKGNLGRFINHSCDPNCRTEKWVVNGEICIGLFALRDIKKGEELTFDYNFVRVVGAAAKRCYCGSPQCRGYIGGDPTDTEVIDQVDSDEEFPEPVMVEEGEAGDDIKHATSKHKDKMDSSRKTIGKSDVIAHIEDSLDQSASVSSQSHGSLELNDVMGYSSSGPPIDLVPQTEDAMSKCLSSVQQEISVEDTVKKASLSIERWEALSNTTLNKSSPEGVANRKPKTVTTDEKRGFTKSRFFIKTSHRSASLKKGKFPIGSTNASKVPLLANKTQVLSIKPKKLMEGTSNGHFEAVQEKLNELLDAEGGISKRKDAPKGYLKLLLLTAASGASGNGESIQSSRELSMILDALLKTKSRMVLMDIINKNGLRMLHNIMKQYRRDFKKIPILRKLLKVLEYLAVRDILTLEHISGGPPFPGMESFMESMLSLTEHDDKQVHQIARSFRDRWIPRHIRKRSYMDRDDDRMEFLAGSNCNWASAAGHWHGQGVRNTDSVDCKTIPLTASVDTAFHEGSSSSGVKTRKRKSRWDQPANGSTCSRSSVLDDGDRASREYSYCPHCARNYCPQDESSSVNAGRKNIHEDVPPGFFSPSVSSLVSSNASSTVSDHPQQSICHLKSPVVGVVGLPQSKFISLLPVSYGIPMSIMQQFGSPFTEFTENWTIAPGIPFYPFPPLPPLPSSHKKESVPCTVDSVAIDETAEQRRWGSHETATCPTEENPSTLGQQGMDFPGASDHQAFKRIRGPTFDIGRRYFRQQKWIKMPPPWIRNRNGWGYMGDKF